MSMSFQTVLWISHHFEADPNSTYQPDAELDADPVKIQLIILMRGCGSRCGSGFLFDEDADSGCQNGADPCGSGSTTLAF